MSSVKEKPMKRKLLASEQDERSDSNPASTEKKKRRKNAVETQRHFPKSERQQLALVLQMTSVVKNPEPASPPPPSVRKTSAGSGRKDKIHKRNVRGETLLHLCTIRGDIGAMKELISQGADVNVQDNAGWTPLHEACNHGHQEITQYLLQVGANVNSKGLEDDTPLHDAVTNSHRDLVELLLKHGANPLLKNKRGERPLDIADDEVIKELMQKEVILSDEESDLDRDCTSPSRSEDSVGSKKILPKERTTSTSSCGQQDLCMKNRKKTYKSKTSPEKPRPFSQLSSDSSSDSDSSDDKPLARKKNSHGLSTLPHSNGYGNSLGKTPTVSAAPLKTPKLKQGRKIVNSSSQKPQKIRTPASKHPYVDSMSSSSDGFSDSDHNTHNKGKNGTNYSQSGESKSSSHTESEKKDHTKQKSLYDNDKSQFNDRNSAQHHVDPSLRRKLSLHSDQVPRVRSSSSEADKSKPKVKSNKLLNEKMKSNSETTQPTTNGLDSGDATELTKDHTDGSVYDFSLSTEDFTDTSAISLKRKYEDKSSELFDIVCLGKKSFDSELNKDLAVVRSTELSASKPQKPSKDRSPSSKNNDKDASVTSILKEGCNLDKNHNKIFGEADKSSKKPQISNVLPSNGTSGQNHVPPKVETLTKETKTADKQSTGKQASLPFSRAESGSIKQEPKSEKKVKKRLSISDSPKKPVHTNGPTAFIKSDMSAKKVNVKSEPFVDGRPEKQKKSSFEGDTKATSETLPSNTGSAKKKKKHKHRHSHDTPSSEHKHRQRVASSEPSVSEKYSSSEKNSSTPSKPLLKKVDSSKSLHGTSSRKNSLESKPDGMVVPAAKKKVRSTDSTSSDTSVKGTKHSSSATKMAKLASTSSSQDKTSAPTSTKKDKTEVKKITLLSDANSAFLSELEKSSKQKQEHERKMKLQRKKKLLLQQQLRLKAQNAAENASKETKTPTTEKSAPPSFEKAPTDSSDITDITRQQQNRVPSHNAMFTHPPGPSDTNYVYRQNYVDPFYENSNSLDRHEFSQGMFKSPPLASRSVSQMDQRAAYPQSQEMWNRNERPPYALPQQKKHAPVQRSLSFSVQQPDGHVPRKSSQELSPHPDSKNNLHQHYYEGIHHRPSMGEVPHGRQPNYPSSSQILHSTSIPQPHPVNGPLLPTGNHPTQHAAVTFVPPVSVNLASSKPLPTSAEALPATNSITHLVTDVTSNVPISSPVIAAKVPVHPVVATPSSGSVSSPSAAIPNQVKATADSDSDAHTKEGAKPTGTNGSGGDDKEEEVKLDEKKEDQVEDVKETETPPKSADEIQETPAQKAEKEQKGALEKYVQDHLSKLEIVFEEPKRLPVFIPMEKLKKTAEKDPIQDRLNVYEEWAVIQKQINEKRKKYYTAVVIPQAPHCYCDYMTYTGAYLLSGNRESWLSVPVLAPPASLSGEMQALFVEHEKERVKLRLQHATQREKLIVACEQEIMRAHSRAARMLQNQQIPLSACSVFLDREVYYLERRNKKVQDDNNGRTSIRDRFNGRMMLSWLQDVDDKYVKMKSVLLARQRHEAQALHAVQRTEWFLKLQEVENQGQQKRWTNSKPEDVSDVYVPLVNISNDFDLLPG